MPNGACIVMACRKLQAEIGPIWCCPTCTKRMGRHRDRTQRGAVMNGSYLALYDEEVWEGVERVPATFCAMLGAKEEHGGCHRMIFLTDVTCLDGEHAEARVVLKVFSTELLRSLLTLVPHYLEL